MVSRNFSLKQSSIVSACSGNCFLQAVELERTAKAQGERQSWHMGIIIFLLFLWNWIVPDLQFAHLSLKAPVLLTPFHLSNKQSTWKNLPSSNDTARIDKSKC